MHHHITWIEFPVTAALLAFAHFNNFPEVSITLHEKGDFKKTRSITLPNTPLVISHPTSKDVKSPVPLSAALWSIYNGRKSLLGSAESPIMKDFIGLQESITKYMQSIREMIEAELARQGDDIGKYITLDYTSLAGVVAREEHHLKVGGLCEYLERGTESTAKLISWFKPGAAPVDIRTEQWAGRDVASLLYVLDHRLREDLRNHPLPQMRTMDSGSCFSSNLTEQNNQILSLCTRLYSLKPPSWQNVKDMITADSEAIKLLQDVWLLAKATNQIKGNDRFNPALNALESIIPQMRVLHKLPEIAAAFDLPGIDPGSKRVRG